MKIQTRWMSNRDHDECRMIEEASSGTKVDKYTFKEMTKGPERHSIVCEVDGYLSGYALYDVFPNCNLLQWICVHPDARRLGAGTKLIKKVKANLFFGRRIFVTAVVPEVLVEACWFFDHLGFLPQNYKKDVIPFVYKYHPEMDGGMTTLAKYCRQMRRIRQG